MGSEDYQEQFKINEGSKERIVNHAKYLIEQKAAELSLSPELTKMVNTELNNIINDENFITMREQTGDWYNKLVKDKDPQNMTNFNNPYGANKLEENLASDLKDAIKEEMERRTGKQIFN